MRLPEPGRPLQPARLLVGHRHEEQVPVARGAAPGELEERLEVG
ncbi:MAG: hypothetical protein M5U13_12385 [Thermoanaerobaculia bacterium]|nr:hypothetical protein [Thermoanaerobaculia bacterium]